MNPFWFASRPRLQESAREAQSKSSYSERCEAEVPAPFALTPLTGRNTEFSLLEDRWEQAQEGMGQIVLVIGEPGLGKSRLVQTLTQLVHTEESGACYAAAGQSESRLLNQESVIEWRC